MMICAQKPWTAASRARLVSAEARGGVPDDAKAEGLDYFLEVHVAKEVLEVFGDRSETVDRKLALLIYYAENDAYPDWAYE